MQGQLRRATQALGAAERIVNSLPIRGERAEGAARIEERRSEAERALGYVELYGSYSETEARFASTGRCSCSRASIPLIRRSSASTPV